MSRLRFHRERKIGSNYFKMMVQLLKPTSARNKFKVSGRTFFARNMDSQRQQQNLVCKKYWFSSLNWCRKRQSHFCRLVSVSVHMFLFKQTEVWSIPKVKLSWCILHEICVVRNLHNQKHYKNIKDETLVYATLLDTVFLK